MNSRLMLTQAPILLAGGALGSSAMLPWQLAWLCALGANIVLGVPHGALDGEIARPLLRRHFGRFWFAVFSLPYIALFALVLLAWRLFPLPTLAAFLTMSVWHFGREDSRVGAVPDVLFRGGLPIVLPALAHPAATAFVFAAAARVPLAVPPSWLTMALTGWLVVAVIALRHAITRKDWPALGSCGTLVVIFIVLPPLTAFALYFVCVHAPSHTAALIRDPRRAPRVASKKAAWLRALPLFVLTLLIAAALWPFYTGSLPLRLLALTFQMLAALTLPHMLLNGWFNRREARRRRGGGADPIAADMFGHARWGGRPIGSGSG